MISEGLELRLLRPSEWDAAVALVSVCGLPVADLVPGKQTFWGAFSAEALVGVIGTERYPDAALVRSMAVAEPARGRGIASTLYGVLESTLGAEGPRALVLLTETAEAFFARRGFTVVPRDDLPDSVKESAEFQGLCPVSAVAMAKTLSGTR